MAANALRVFMDMLCAFRIEECPELGEMDVDTFGCLADAYDYGSFNGRSPGDIYEDWEHGLDPPSMQPCPVCGEAHW